MRVISGKYKGRRLDSPVNNDIRPTSDRIKETIFNVLASRMEFDGLRVLDLFSGSGALGIEALSRGAAGCVFIDKSPDGIALTRQNLSFVREDVQTFNTDYAVAIRKLEGKSFDLIFADPPYHEKLESKLLNLIFQHKILDKNGILLIEHDSNNLIAEHSEFYFETRKCGNTSLTFAVLREGNHE